MALFSYQCIGMVAGGALRALPGATVTVYQTGTTTRAPIFDAFGNAVSNPGTADSYGIFAFTATDGAYDLVVTLGSYLTQQTIQIATPLAALQTTPPTVAGVPWRDSTTGAILVS